MRRALASRDASFAADSGVVRCDLLDPGQLRRYATRPELLLQELRHRLSGRQDPVTVIIDEIQKLPALLDVVQLLMGESRGRARFVLAGSSARKLRRTGTNRLGGRALTCYLHPFSSAEVAIDLDRALRVGTLPAVYLDDSGSEVDSLEAYVGTYLKEEVFAEALVRRTERFSRFLEIAAQMNGEPTNFSKLGRQCGVTSKTAEEYFAILCDTLLAHRLDGWSESARRQLRQAPKYFLFDCGVLNALSGEVRAAAVPGTARYGRLFETFIVQELVRQNDSRRLGLRFNYWRTREGREVDVIISRAPGRPLAAVEIKSRADPADDDLDGLHAFHRDHPRVSRFCLCTTPQPYDLGGVSVLPWRSGVPEILGGP
jgi:predicted AAA+ superfamily ATPase